MPDCQTQQKSDKIKVAISITFPIPWNFASPGLGHRNTRTQTLRREIFRDLWTHLQSICDEKSVQFLLVGINKKDPQTRHLTQLWFMILQWSTIRVKVYSSLNWTWKYSSPKASLKKLHQIIKKILTNPCDNWQLWACSDCFSRVTSRVTSSPPARSSRAVASPRQTRISTRPRHKCR